MFNKQNFCHVASNNRNDQKAGLFVYKTEDNLTQVTTSGYFNERIIDLNLHDLILHVMTDHIDRTKVRYNVLTVSERTLENVATTVIATGKEMELEQLLNLTREQYGQAIADLQEDKVDVLKNAARPGQNAVAYGRYNSTDTALPVVTEVLAPNAQSSETSLVTTRMLDTVFKTEPRANNLGVTMKELSESVSTSLRFIGFVSLDEPTQVVADGNLWIIADEMPTTFPISEIDISIYENGVWTAYTGGDYTPADLDMFRNNNDNEGYYWFGGEWKVMSTDMNPEQFELNEAGKWSIISSVHLPGRPTAHTEPLGSVGTQIATTEFVANAISNMLSTIWPVGSTYMSSNNSCPMATLIPGSTWTLVSSGKALWTGNGTNGNTTIAAGLPNITATFWTHTEVAGAVANIGSNNTLDVTQNEVLNIKADFNASRSSSIYGNSTTVQPPAYVVNVWRRTA